VAFLSAQTDLLARKPRVKDAPSPDTQALATFCHALLGSNAFLYVD
jgi:hypothetical protein